MIPRKSDSCLGNNVNRCRVSCYGTIKTNGSPTNRLLYKLVDSVLTFVTLQGLFNVRHLTQFKPYEKRPIPYVFSKVHSNIVLCFTCRLAK